MDKNLSLCYYFSGKERDDGILSVLSLAAKKRDFHFFSVLPDLFGHISFISFAHGSSGVSGPDLHLHWGYSFGTGFSERKSPHPSASTAAGCG